MIEKEQLRKLVNEVLLKMELHSDEAVELILGTIAQESTGGRYIRQITGPALGICQMEPTTFKDIVNNYIKYKLDLGRAVMFASGVTALKSEMLEYNLAFSIAMCRIHYLRVPEGLPSDLEGYARYWKQYYNTVHGKGTVEEFIANYKKCVKC